MTSLESMPECIETLKVRLANDATRSSLKGFSRRLKISLTDLEANYIFTIRDGELIHVERDDDSDAEVTVTITCSLMEAILNKTANPILAYFMGKLKISGTRDDILRLQKLMG